MTYAGDLVALRAREPEDAATIVAWLGDAETARYWDPAYPPLPVDAFAARIAESPPPSFADSVRFAVEDRASGTLIGLGTLHRPSPEHRHAELALMIGDPACRGRGYGTDLTRTLCRFGFDRMNLVRIWLEVFAENDAARRAYDRAGFAIEGVRRRAFWMGGAFHDAVCMAVFPDTLR